MGLFLPITEQLAHEEAGMPEIRHIRRRYSAVGRIPLLADTSARQPPREADSDLVKSAIKAVVPHFERARVLFQPERVHRRD